jgi:hypothetical protein
LLLVLAGVLLVLLASWSVFFVCGKLQELRQEAQSVQVLGHLNQLAFAMRNYQDVHGTLPPAAVYDPEGRPLLSWRVLLLPYIEGEALYRQFKLDEPWDSPHNIKLLDQMPISYGPFDGPIAPKPYTTFCRVFVGPGAAFEGQHGLNTKTDFPDGPGSTLLIVTAAEAVPWTMPAELPYAPHLPLPRLGGPFPDHFHVALANGKARRIYNSVSQATLRATITRNGGELLGTDW